MIVANHVGLVKENINKIDMTRKYFGYAEIRKKIFRPFLEDCEDSTGKFVTNKQLLNKVFDDFLYLIKKFDSKQINKKKMKQTLEQILQQDCTNFVKIEKLNEYNKQNCLDFLYFLHENDLRMFSPTEFFDIYDNHRRYDVETLYKSFANCDRYL